MNRRTFVAGVSTACALAAARRVLAAAKERSPLEQRIHSQLLLGVSEGLTNGAVMMVMQHGKVLALEAAGYAAAETKTPMRSDAIFDIRSICKVFTVFGALLLVDEGKLSLTSAVAEFLPDFAGAKVKGSTRPISVPITIQQLMTHSAGIAADRPPELESITRTFDHTLAEDVALVAQQPLDFVPGTQWAYSSSGIAVLGRVIEVVAGQPFQDFMQQRVFAPLGMRDSSFFTNREKEARIATMYTIERDHLVRDVMDVTRPGQKYSAPDFGMFSTADDLSRFGQMMLEHGSWKGRRMLSPQLIDAMTRPEKQTADPEFSSGLGFFLHPKGASQMGFAATDGSYGAAGASGGILWIDPNLQLIRIYLTSYFLGNSRDADPAMNAAFPG